MAATDDDTVMRAWRVEALAEDLSGLALRDLPVPAPGPGEVRLRMRAAALNFPDILMAQGRYQRRPNLPFVPGMEGAGEVTALGDGVQGPSVGDRVVGGAGTGSLAEYQVLPASAVRPLPAGLSLAEGAAFGVAYITAYVALHRRGQLRPGETLLVLGAAGGVGLAAVEIGKLMGATVIAAASSAEKRALAATRGADHVVDSGGSFREAVKDLTDGRGADVIYDPVGGDAFDQAVRCIAWGGRLLVIGFASGRIATLDTNLPLIKGFSVVGVRAGEFRRRNPELGAEDVARVDRWAAEGRIKPYIGATLPFDKADLGLRLLQDRQAVGKVVVEIG